MAATSIRLSLVGACARVSRIAPSRPAKKFINTAIPILHVTKQKTKVTLSSTIALHPPRPLCPFMELHALWGGMQNARASGIFVYTQQLRGSTHVQSTQMKCGL
jgi:hypothetical protein